MAVTGHWHLEKRICRGEKGAGEGNSNDEITKTGENVQKISLWGAT